MYTNLELLRMEVFDAERTVKSVDEYVNKHLNDLETDDLIVFTHIITDLAGNLKRMDNVLDKMEESKSVE